MAPITIFQLIFLVGAIFGAAADMSGKAWGRSVAFGGLILFGILLVVAK